MKPEGEGKAEDGMVQGMSGEAGYPNGNPTTTRTKHRGHTLHDSAHDAGR